VVRRLLVILLLVVLVPSAVRAFETASGRGIGLGQTVILSDPSASTLLAVPSGGLADRQGRIELGVIRRFDIKELDQGYLAAVFRRGSLTCAAGLTQFGYDNLYAERTARFAAACHYDSLTIGAGVSIMQIDFGGHYDDLTGTSLTLGLSYRHRRVLGAFTVDNLNSPRLSKHSEPFRPKYTLHAELIGPGSYSVTGRVTAQECEKPDFGVGQKIDLSSMAALFWGLSTAPIIYGGGLELIYKRSFITYATSYHPTLGFSHTLSVSFTIGKTGSAADGQSQESRH
jgi:hypothetical protein